MIKFFRKIRRGFLTENKFKKYILYAVGEIILVVIGILIALQINNWNQHNLKQDAGYIFFDQIKSDLINDTLHYKSYKDILSSSILKFESCIESEFSNDSIILEVAKIFDKNADPRVFGKSHKNFSESDSYGIFTNSELLKKIEDYYSKNCRLYNNYAEYHRHFITNNIEGYFIHKQLINKRGDFNLKSLKNEIKSGSFVSVIHFQYQTYKKMLSIVQTNDRKAKRLIVALEELKKTKAQQGV